MTKQTELPGWVEEETLKELKKLQKLGVACADGYLIQRGIRLVLERLEKTREKDKQLIYLADADFNKGRESIRKEVLCE